MAIGSFSTTASQTRSNPRTNQRPYGGRRARTAASEAVSIVRYAGRSKCRAMPPVRSEHELRHGSCEPVAQPFIAYDFACDLWNSELELLALRREPNGDNSHEWISGSGGWRPICADEFWRYRRSRPAEFRRLSPAFI